MTEVVSVRFKSKGKVYYFDPAGVTAATGDNVIVDTAKGQEYAECVRGNHTVEDGAVRPPLRPVVRVATEDDRRRAENNRRREIEAFRICREKIKKHGLDMKLVDVEYNFEGNKTLFFFTSEGRVDFRELVKDLASVFKTRIELRQIGVRDEARMLGGIGICGKPFCCAQFLDDFQPVSIKMAKTQGLSLNPTKISGACGRLMCCLKYEQEAYESLVKNVPKVDSFVETPQGKGSVTDVNLLKGSVRVRLEDQTETAVRTFDASEVTVLGGKAKRAEYLAMKAEGKIEEVRPVPRFRRTPASAAPERPQPAEAEAAPTGQPAARHHRQKPRPQKGEARPFPDAKPRPPRPEGLRDDRPRDDRPHDDRPRPAKPVQPGEAIAEAKPQNRRHGYRRGRRPDGPRPEGEPRLQSPRPQQEGEQPRPQPDIGAPKPPRPQAEPPRPQGENGGKVPDGAE